jgi:hypothetical protein
VFDRRLHRRVVGHVKLDHLQGVLRTGRPVAKLPGRAGVAIQRVVHAGVDVMPVRCELAGDLVAKTLLQLVSDSLPKEGRLLRAWRPEDVAIESDGTPGFNRLRATIASAAYFGDRIRYVVRTAGGKALMVFGSRRMHYDPGTVDGIRVETRVAMLWAGEASV